MTVSQKIASLLLETKAVKLSPAQPFKWSSGWNSPIYCDNRVTLSFAEGRTFIKKSLAKAIKKHFPDAELVAGVATAGIPQGALVADALGLPLLMYAQNQKSMAWEIRLKAVLKKAKKLWLSKI